MKSKSVKKMDSFNFDNIKAEKANAISRYQRMQRITTLFRVVELCFVLIVVSKFSTQLSLPPNLSGEYFKGIAVAMISPRFVFLVGNAIVLVLFFKSGRFSGKDGDGIADFYDEYVEKCGIRNQEREGSDAREGGKMCRSSSEKIVVMHGGGERRRELTRSVTEGCRSRRKTAAAEEMSSEEFRRTVEAFIARQQRFLREED